MNGKSANNGLSQQKGLRVQLQVPHVPITGFSVTGNPVFPHSERTSQHQSEGAMRLAVRLDKIDADPAGDETCSRPGHLGVLLVATHDEDLCGKTHAATSGIRTESFEDLAFQFGHLFFWQGGEFCAKLF
jgi:hypothetical protein